MENETTNVLPDGFDGVFRFTNFTDKEFKPKWNSVEYTYPPLSTVPMIIPGATLEEIQTIRKKFAKELAVLCFYGTAKFAGMDDRNQGEKPPLYTESDLEPFIQRCLEPLPVAQATMRVLPKDNANYLSKDNEGDPVTRVLKEKESLLKQGSGAVA